MYFDNTDDAYLLSSCAASLITVDACRLLTPAIGIDPALLAPAILPNPMSELKRTAATQVVLSVAVEIGEKAILPPARVQYTSICRVQQRLFAQFRIV
jgi:hypothetical protein